LLSILRQVRVLRPKLIPPDKQDKENYNAAFHHQYEYAIISNRDPPQQPLAKSTSNETKAVQKVRQAKWVLRSVQEEKPLGVEPRAGIVLEDA
jgi:hypothetical protein